MANLRDVLHIDVSLLELLKVDPSELYEKQFEMLKTHALETLETVARCIRNDNYKAIRKILNHSYAGDGNGNEKSFIDFEFSDNSEGDDIEDLLTKLTQIKDLATRTKIDRK